MVAGGSSCSDSRWGVLVGLRFYWGGVVRMRLSVGVFVKGGVLIRFSGEVVRYNCL